MTIDKYILMSKLPQAAA